MLFKMPAIRKVLNIPPVIKYERKAGELSTIAAVYKNYKGLLIYCFIAVTSEMYNHFVCQLINYIIKLLLTWLESVIALLLTWKV